MKVIQYYTIILLSFTIGSIHGQGYGKIMFSVGEKINEFDPLRNTSTPSMVWIEREAEKNSTDTILKRVKREQYELSLNKNNLNNNISNKTEVQGFQRGRVFKANSYDGSTPSDNTLAISNSGYFVSAINTTVNFYDSTGKQLVSKTLSAFANDNSLTFTFDPKVIYDQEEHKFILVFLNGNTPSSSKVVIAFSTSDDPRQKWNVYKISGNPLKDNSWTDYPNIGVSKKDLYICTNLFTSLGMFSQANISQIPKSDGFSGSSSLKVGNFYDLNDGNFSPLFGIYPLQGGQDNLYGSGMYFASTATAFGSSFSITHIDNDYGNNPQIEVNTFSTTPFRAGRDASQKSNSDLLLTGGSRVKGGFRLRNNLYFVFGGTINNGIWNGIIYIKFDIASSTHKMAYLNTQYESYAYPNIASFATDEYDETVIICFNASSNKYFPEARMVSCDQWMNFSAQDTFKKGDTYIEVLGTGVDERWGDYSGIARWHGKSYRSVWAHNMIGQIQSNGTRRIGNWIGEARSYIPSFQGVVNTTHEFISNQPYPNPAIEKVSYLKLKVSYFSRYIVDVVSLDGKYINKISDSELKPSEYIMRVDMSGMPAGIYFVRILSQNGLVETHKIIVE